MNKNILRLIPFLAFAGIFVFFSHGCDKDSESDPVIEIATLTTASVSDISFTSAKSGGNITDDGGSQITARGVVWSTSANPTLQDNAGQTSDGTGAGTFTSSITGLDDETSYYVRAYATNSEGTAYGNQVQFSTSAYLPAEVTTGSIEDITDDSAKGGGNVTDDGGSPVTARGVVWSTTEDPTLDDNEGYTSDGNGTGEFTSEISGLDNETKYYARAYATNSWGTAYGEQVQFTTLFGTVTDADGNLYVAIKIGDQVWMAENLRTTKYNDETDILNITGDNQWKVNETTGAYAWYDNEESNGEIYGAIYNWIAVETGKLCPTGWRVPSDADWTELTDYAGGLEVAGGKLKETGTEHWADPNEGATDEYEFGALPGGTRFVLDGTFRNIGEIGFWWTSTPDGANRYYRAMGYDVANVTRWRTSDTAGMSVRCIKE